MSIVEFKKDKFSIFMGEPRGEEAFMGRVKKGMTITEGPITKAQIIPGTCGFPNYGIGWGRRVIREESGKMTEPKRRVEILDRDYIGEVQWLSWGDDKGYPIYYRYVRGQSSLDYDYQTKRLGMRDIKEDDEHGYLMISSGENVIFPQNDQAFSVLMQIHYMNQDSLSRDPNAMGSMWRLIKPLDTEESNVKQLDREFEAMKIVKEHADSFERLNVIRNIVESKKQIQYDESKQTGLFDALMIIARNTPEFVLDGVKEYKDRVSKVISLCESYEAIDYKVDNMIVAVKPKKEILLNDITVKGKQINEWIFNNCLNPEVFALVEKLIMISQNFK